jgi:uncharacterized protein YqjF (DUF2071 family)
VGGKSKLQKCMDIFEQGCGRGIALWVLVGTNEGIYTFSIVSRSHHVVIFTRSIKRINYYISRNVKELRSHYITFKIQRAAASVIEINNSKHEKVQLASKRNKPTTFSMKLRSLRGQCQILVQLEAL